MHRKVAVKLTLLQNNQDFDQIATKLAGVRDGCPSFHFGIIVGNCTSWWEPFSKCQLDFKGLPEKLWRTRLSYPPVYFLE